MSDREAALLERIDILESEVEMLRALTKDVDAGFEHLRNAGINADRKLMEVSRAFAFLLVTKFGGEAEMQMDALESWASDPGARVVVALERDPGSGTYKARAVTREEAGRLVK